MNVIFVILEQPCLATINALINCRNEVMNLFFSNMKLELNVFSICKRPHDKEDDDSENGEIELIKLIIEDHIYDENFTSSTKFILLILFN